jgi:Tfp pilus assembly protein PilF
MVTEGWISVPRIGAVSTAARQAQGVRRTDRRGSGHECVSGRARRFGWLEHRSCSVRGFSAAQIADPNANNQIPMQHPGSGALSGSWGAGEGYNAAQQYQLGLAALAAGKIHEAERAFEDAVTADRTNANAQTMRGVARERGGDLNGAAHDFETSLKMDPTQITALREYGVTLARQGKADKAKSQLGPLKLQSEACADTTCPDAAKLKDAVAAVQEAA